MFGAPEVTGIVLKPEYIQALDALTSDGASNPGVFCPIIGMLADRIGKLEGATAQAIADVFFGSTDVLQREWTKEQCFRNREFEE
jgi:hypothetical protein